MTYKGNTDAHRKGNMKYLKESVDSISVRMPKGTKAKLQSIANDYNTSINQVVNTAINHLLDHPEIIKEKPAIPE